MNLSQVSKVLPIKSMDEFERVIEKRRALKKEDAEEAEFDRMQQEQDAAGYV